MLGVIAGDIIGSKYEFSKIKRYDFEPLFHPKSKYTDDTICTTAVMKSILDNSCPIKTMHSHCRKYFSTGGWGQRFIQWMASKDPQPYESWGNGSAMRIAPVGWVVKTPEEVIALSDKYTLITHNHPEAVDAARATSLSVFYARQGKSPDEIRHLLSVYYILDYSINDIRDEYQRTERAKDSVPQAITAALEATSFEDAIRLAVSLGGDTDTQAAIAGGVAEARFGVPKDIKNQALCYLDDDLTDIVMDFYKQF
ncbi:ADP-ribosylglycohydrolase family protein [Alteromonas sp. LMIT006]|uniref:ADP-ribosylglycohydrolase family protein n=1 Tax=Alteromonadaceae TaxID=72275 RepID=UPI0020CA4D55|nr:ADP-ribosylglycohydrolase family protein [Alteromonas sp. LMIT006]UTP72769.1 ADP-ribosylglycohydrolase family protein [Alteromonas sp. LMIT006]